jgi:hypothetical protein
MNEHDLEFSKEDMAAAWNLHIWHKYNRQLLHFLPKYLAYMVMSKTTI